jgi:hypothetical protein
MWEKYKGEEEDTEKAIANYRHNLPKSAFDISVGDKVALQPSRLVTQDFKAYPVVARDVLSAERFADLRLRFQEWHSSESAKAITIYADARKSSLDIPEPMKSEVIKVVDAALEELANAHIPADIPSYPGLNSLVFKTLGKAWERRGRNLPEIDFEKSLETKLADLYISNPWLNISYIKKEVCGK